MQQQPRSVLSFAIALSLIASGAAALESVVRNIVISGNVAGLLLNQDAVEARQATARSHRRAASRIQRECQDRANRGEAVDCAVVNDDIAEEQRRAKQPRNIFEEPEHRSAPETDVGTDDDVLTVDDLTEHQKSLLRWYQRTGSCAMGLNQLVPGFYELCVSIIGPRGENGRIQGIITDKASIKMKRAAPYRNQTLNDRLRVTPRARPDR
jgi:hypothetical protein